MEHRNRMMTWIGASKSQCSKNSQKLTNIAIRGYDWKLGKDDCTFAFRNVLHSCNTKSNEFLAGDYTYRCVNYTLFHTNCKGSC